MKKIAPHQGMLHLARSVAQAGIDARSTVETGDFEFSEHHKSALMHLDKLLEGSWKDARKGRILYLTDESEHLLAGVVSVPLGFVPKSFPDRTVSRSEGREVVDPVKQNENVLKEHFHPALMPRHSELARLITWWAQRHPGIAILMARRDIADAFKWLWILAESAGMFSTRFSKGQAGIKQSLVPIWLVLNFGWRGGPGCFVQFGTLLKLLHANFRPAGPKFNDEVPFRSMIWMDDLVVIEPDLGHRALVSLGIAEGLTHKIFGPASLNRAKDLVEGIFETLKLTWGLTYDTQRLCRRLPDPKLEKAAFLLHMSSFDRGCLQLMFKLV
jgi:hypothetical protein